MNKIAYLQAMGIDVWQPKHKAIPIDTTIVQASPVLHDLKKPESDQDVWTSLEQECKSCTACGLEKTRTHVVFGVGNRQADILFVGEAPGAQEDKQGEPFVGRAGQLLNNMLAAIQLKREDVYIANILKCRPPNNRDPKPEEVALCTPFLLRQITLIRPKLIVALGRISAHFLLNTDTALGKMRGREYKYSDLSIPLIVTYHPAYLLRSPTEKRKAWEDLLRIKAYLSA